ncbi:MAG TPA: P-II family nitrogen regulator [Candidatus Scatomorpha gallistercoris]|nr:P-II family nitrogen regulator [Candidatus Scatomorpha gallistercoris]
MILNLVAVIVDRSRAKLTAELFESHKLPMVLAMLARGTATSEVLDLYGLEATDKTLLVTVAGGDMTHQLMRAAKRKLFIDVPGNGIMLAIPIKSVGGGRTLAFISGGAAPDSSAPELKFEHELIMAVINEGHTDPVMDAARSAGAAGGTVLHAKGTGGKLSEKFLGVSLADEKEVVLIVSKSAEKAAIMRAISERCGVDTPAGAIAFSLPISSVVGLRVLDDD